jgi:hypothetical protein
MLILALLLACGDEDKTPKEPVKPEAVKPAAPALPSSVPVGNTCSGTYPSYWQDPAFAAQGMWEGQKVSNTPESAGWTPDKPYYTNPVFQLSDKLPAAPVDDRGSQPWRDEKYGAIFAAGTAAATRTQLAEAYLWAIMDYIQAGNTGSGDLDTDWSLCDNKVRPWYHIPYQTYEVLAGRDFVHGLTREAPVTFSLKNVKNADGTDTLNTVVWAVGFYNATAAATLGSVWGPSGSPTIPTQNLKFDDGAVIGKLLWSTATPAQFPNLTNLPAWTANMSGFQDGQPTATPMCTPTGPDKNTMVGQSEQCARSLGTVYLMQFDIAVRDPRAPLGWVYGTFVADGEHKAGESDPWKRISPLGMMWGNDTPPAGQTAYNYPPDARATGFSEEVVFWDVVDRLNAAGGAVPEKFPGHMGCADRLNGPADNASGSCLSCHMTASVPDQNIASPPLMTQFSGGKITTQCANPTTNKDAGGGGAAVVDGVSYAQIDAVYFDNTMCGDDMNFTTAGTPPVTVSTPSYASGAKEWIGLDYSLQLNISLRQWMEWQKDRDQKIPAAKRDMEFVPSR